MAIIQRTPQEDVNEYLVQQIARREKSLIRTFNFVGVQCVNEARTNGNYMDQTGNLRSSIGYVVLKDGIVLHKSQFNKVKNGSEGVKDGKEFISDLIANNTKGIVLIVVAGMNYASYVETSRDVITSAELLAERMVPQMLKQLGFIVR